MLAAGSCFRFEHHPTKLNEHEARDRCGSLGGVLASLSHPETRMYLWRVFRYYRSLVDGYTHIGLRSTPDGYPLM